MNSCAGACYLCQQKYFAQHAPLELVFFHRLSQKRKLQVVSEHMFEIFESRFNKSVDASLRIVAGVCPSVYCCVAR